MKNSDILCLGFFEHNIDGETFRKLYQKSGGTEHMADHMWSKFTDYNHSFLRTFGMADSGNRDILFTVAETWCEENDYPGKE